MRKAGCYAVLLFTLTLLGWSAEQPRVFVTDSQSWEMVGHAAGGWNNNGGGFAGSTRGGARPQTAEIIKTFGERCPGVITNNRQEKADYIVLLDHEGGKGLARKDNKVAVFSGNGDTILSKSTRSLGNSVKDACTAITKDWAEHGEQMRTAAAKAQERAVTAPGLPRATTAAKLSVASTPDGADIEVDGNFVGNTPSAIELAAGEHTISVKKPGYKNWERKLTVTGGEIKINAELEKSVDVPRSK